MADQKLDPKIRAHVGPSDIVQQTMIKLVDGIDHFKGESTPEFFGWINKIVRNETLAIGQLGFEIVVSRCIAVQTGT